MLRTTTDFPGDIALLAEHLDAALAAGEDLGAERLPAAADQAEASAAGEGVQTFAARLVRHELALLAHVLQARRRALEIAGAATAAEPMRPVLRLFAANTAGLLDIVATFGDRIAQRFASGDDPVELLRKRGLIAIDQASVPHYTDLAVTDTYRVCGVLELGRVLDLVASLLDLLDRHYGLWPEDVAEAATDTAPAAGPAVAERGPGSLSEALAAMRDPAEL